MPFPKCSPLQSRLAASLTALAVLLLLYTFLSLPRFAYASKLEPKPPDDNSDELSAAQPWLEHDLHLRDSNYVADFLGVDRSIIGRVPSDGDPKELANNQMVVTNLDIGETLNFFFSNASLKELASDPRSSLPLPNQPRWLDREGVAWVKQRRGLDEIDEEEGEEGHDSARIRSRQVEDTSVFLYVTVNVCRQPMPDDGITGPPPQLQLYLSQSSSNTKPGPDQDPSTQTMLTLSAGAGLLAINAAVDVYFGLTSPNMTGYAEGWNAEIAASIEAPYHYFHVSDANLVLVDSDSTSALLVTQGLVNSTVNATLYDDSSDFSPLFTIFASKKNNAEFEGIANSYCGLQKYADVSAANVGNSSGSFETGITSRGSTRGPRQQFYVTGLSSATIYYGILALGDNGSPNRTAKREGTVGGGGQVFKTMQFSTMSDENCAVIFNLSFCDKTAYAVPANSERFDDAFSLAAFYDNSIQKAYSFFQKVLAQIPCETTDSAQYSLVKNCEDCATAYKDWLCSVGIPRCTDFSSNLPWLQQRNMMQSFPNGTNLDPDLMEFASQSLPINSSRNPAIDEIVAPGPYKEILPCEDVCYSVVQSCPAAMGFQCPRPGNLGFHASYGLRPSLQQQQNGDLTCNFPGATFLHSTATRISLSSVLLIILAALTWKFI